MGLLGDVLHVAGEIVGKVLGWTTELLYRGTVMLLDVFMKKRKAKAIAAKLLPIALAVTTAIGAYYLWLKIVQPAAKFVLATAVAGVAKVTLGAGLTKSIVIASFIYKYWTVLYWVWGASMVYGVYTESRKVTRAVAS